MIETKTQLDLYAETKKHLDIGDINKVCDVRWVKVEDVEKLKKRVSDYICHLHIDCTETLEGCQCGERHHDPYTLMCINNVLWTTFDELS